MRNRNISIQFIKVIAMLMIITDHILCMVSFPMQPVIVQVTNSGVFIFLFISGYLFGQKQVTDWKKWSYKRFTRIFIPLWIFMVVDFIVEALVLNNFDIKYVFIYAFNLQGILGVTYPSNTLWFLTLIMICYIITPFLQYIKNKKLNIKYGIMTIMMIVIAQIVLAYITDIGMVAGHTLSWCILAVSVYIIGYFIGNKILNDSINYKRIVTITIITFFATIIGLLSQKYLDGTVIYNRVIIYYAMLVIDLWICTAVYKLAMYIKNTKLISVLNHADGISYEFYIVHQLIIVTITSKILERFGVVSYIISSLVLAYLGAILLHWICEKIYKIVK